MSSPDSSGSLSPSSGGRVAPPPGGKTSSSAVTVMQPGVLHLTGAAIATFGSLGGDGTVVVDNGNLTVGGNNLSSTFSGTLSLPAGWSLTKVGNGVFSLGAPLTVPGGISLNAGALGLAVAGALGATGQISFGGGALQFSAADTSDYSSRFSIAGTQRYRFDTNGVDVTMAASLLCPSGSLVKLGAGALILNNFNSFSFGITLSGGFVELGHSLALGNNGGIVFQGGGLRFTASNTTDYSARFSIGSNQAFSFDTNGFDITLATARSSSGGSLKKYGPGVLTLAAAFTYSGRTTILDGTLRLADFTTLSSGTMISIAPRAIFDMASYSATVGSLDGGGSVNMGSGTLDIGNDNASTGVFSGSMTGVSGALTKSGTGTQTFAGASLIYDGPTVIARGTMAFTGATTSTISGTASVRVGGSTAATLAGMPSIVLADNGTFTVDNLGILNPGAGSATGLAINSPSGGAAAVLFQAGCTVRFTLANSQGAGNAPVPTDYTAINVSSPVGVTLDGAIDTVINASANIGDLFPIIVGAGSVAGVFANANAPAPNSGGSCYRFTASNGSVWDLNTEWTGSVPQAGVDATAFEQTTGGMTVALLRVS